MVYYYNRFDEKLMMFLRRKNLKPADLAKHTGLESSEISKLRQLQRHHYELIRRVVVGMAELGCFKSLQEVRDLLEPVAKWLKPSQIATIIGQTQKTQHIMRNIDTEPIEKSHYLVQLTPQDEFTLKEAEKIIDLVIKARTVDKRQAYSFFFDQVYLPIEQILQLRNCLHEFINRISDN